MILRNPIQEKTFPFTLATVLLLVGICSSGAQAATSRFAKLDGNRVHYKSYGQGDEAIVFIHGAMNDLDYWQNQSSAFEGKKRVILIDLPGHGMSDKPKIVYSMDLFAKSINAVLKDAGVKRAIVVGHSFGTAVVRQFYRLYPDKTRALVFVDGGLRPLAPNQEMGEQFIAPFRSPEYMKAAENFINTFIVTPQTTDEMRKEMLGKWANTPQHVIVSVLELSILPNTAPEVWKEDNVNVPVLAIYTKMPYVPADNEQFFRRIAPNIDYQVWDGVGHNLIHEKPEKFNDVMRAFLIKIGALSQAQ